MILNTRRNSSPRLAKTRLGIFGAAAVAAAAFSLYCAPRLVLAQAPEVVSADTEPEPGEPAAPVAATPAPEPPGPDLAPQGGADDPTPAPGGVGAGPKIKMRRGPAALAIPPEPPVAGVPATPAIPGVPPVPGRAPRAMALARGPSPYDPSIEKRLERLEQMMASMMDEKNVKKPGNFYYWEPNMKDFPRSRNKFTLEEQAEREAAAGAEQAKRAAEEARRANEQLERSLKMHQEWRTQGLPLDAAKKQIEALRQARESLGREMENLERQIERLERERERIQKDVKRQSENKEERSEETPAPRK